MHNPNRTNVALRETFADFGRAVAAALNATPDDDGPGWTHEAEFYASGSVRLKHPAGWRLRIWRPRSTGHMSHRLTVTGCTPEGWWGDSKDEITVASNRPAPAVAAEIRRRLLPGHRATMRQALADRAQEERYARARQAAMARLRQALPALEPYGHDQDGSSGSFYAGQAIGRFPAHASGTVRINHHGGSVQLDLHSVPLERAVRILSVLDAAHQPLSGTLMPRALPRSAPELTAPARIVPGEVVAAQPPAPDGASAAAPQAAPPARPRPEAQREEPAIRVSCTAAARPELQEQPEVLPAEPPGAEAARERLGRALEAAAAAAAEVREAAAQFRALGLSEVHSGHPRDPAAP
ncbi:hypothetical protein F7Q99_36180 [Streptomyces kaniharaensis]|uniref:Uncharacterized protein n=1 Tax=Streptomyces kaniharaensis TaxID=212423 RepID=A0A6N7L1F3_9ACTN|nr:hypothetical protein [Streptomyces kaniharaensis]MQS17481.1 hypothetical protein [Streptomyces kaniharaensis]